MSNEGPNFNEILKKGLEVMKQYELNTELLKKSWPLIAVGAFFLRKPRFLPFITGYGIASEPKLQKVLRESLSSAATNIWTNEPVKHKKKT